MANQAPVKDPFKWGVLILGVVLILSAVVFLLLALKNTVVSNTVVGERDIETLKINNAAILAEKSKSAIASVESRIAPVGTVIVGAGGAASGKVVASRSGEEVYTAVCVACHSATGLPTAPKINEKEAWEARASKNGFKGLLDSAIKGTSGGMPARAGQNISDEELTAAIAYMTKEAGLTLDIPLAAKEVKKEEALVAKEVKKEEASVAEEVEKEEAPVAEEVKKEEAPVAKEVKKEEAPVAKEVKKEEAPVAEEANSVTTAAVVAEKASNVVDATTETAKTVTEEVVEVAQSDNGIGEKIYKKTCFSCHATGVLSAPRFGNVEEWKARIALGKEELYKSAIQGKQSMPPKGGNFSLSDDDIKAVVDYMVSKSS